MQFSTFLADVVELALFLLIVGTAVIVLVQMARGKIDLTDLIEEPSGKASVSRFQFLLFTFVIAGVWLLLSVQSGSLQDPPQNVLWLLGISGGSYGASKAIQTWGDSGSSSTAAPGPAPAPAPTPAPAPPPAPAPAPAGGNGG